MIFVLDVVCSVEMVNITWAQYQAAATHLTFELRGLFAFPKHPDVVFYSEGRAKTWLLTQTVVLCLKSSQKGLDFLRIVHLRVIQAYHPQVLTRCQQLLAASMVLLQMPGRNFKKDCSFYSLLPRRENGTSEKSVEEGPRPVINFGEWSCAGREVAAFCCVFAKRLFPCWLLMLRAHLRLAGALGYLSWI